MKILLCNQSYKDAENAIMSLLPGHELISCAPDKVSSNLDGVDIVIPSVAPISKEILESAKFGLIQQLGVGVDNVDLEAATKLGVLVANVPGAGSGNAESVAELAVLMILSLGRKLDEARRNLADGVFFKPSGFALLNKTVCIVGLGDIGLALAERLKGFSCRLIAARRNASKEVPAEYGIEKVFAISELHQALAQSDFVVLALPENAETKGLFSAQLISEMKKGSFLINVARGGIVDLDALNNALENGHLAGAGLDVFSHEPCDATHAIFKQNLIATPHIGGNTDESVRGVIKAIVENVKLYASGHKPKHLLNNPATLRGALHDCKA